MLTTTLEEHLISLEQYYVTLGIKDLILYFTHYLQAPLDLSLSILLAVWQGWRGSEVKEQECLSEGHRRDAWLCGRPTDLCRADKVCDLLGVEVIAINLLSFWIINISVRTIANS